MKTGVIELVDADIDTPLMDIDTPLVMTADEIEMPGTTVDTSPLFQASKEFCEYGWKGALELKNAYIEVEAHIRAKERNLFDIERAARKVGAAFDPASRALAKRILINSHDSKRDVSALYRKRHVILVLLENMTDDAFAKEVLNDQVEAKVAELRGQLEESQEATCDGKM